MHKTFPIRRDEILNHPKPLSELLKVYPSLKRKDQVRHIVIVIGCTQLEGNDTSSSCIHIDHC